MRRQAGIVGLLLVGMMTFGLGSASAQDKPAAPDSAKQSVAGETLNGEWDGSVESPNGTISFVLTLKIEKDAASGEIASQEGAMPVTGKWIDGKLELGFDYNGTPMVMTGAPKDDQLSGDMNYGGGQAIMPWSAKRRAAK